jgi:hypothetical protein
MEHKINKVLDYLDSKIKEDMELAFNLPENTEDKVKKEAYTLVLDDLIKKCKVMHLEGQILNTAILD